MQSIELSQDLKWLPKWKNPRVGLMKTTNEDISTHDEIIEGDNLEEKKVSNKNGPISLLSSNATSLDTDELPASVICYLPKTLTLLEFDISEREPFSLESVSKASKQSSCNHNDINSASNDILPRPAWLQLCWPPKLTSLTIYMRQTQPLHLECLPPTLKKLVIVVCSQLKFEGGDLAHMAELSTFRLFGQTQGVITSLRGLPRSLQSFAACTTFVDEQPLLQPDFENFFFNLTSLDLTRGKFGADVILHLPRTLKVLNIDISANGPPLREEHFKKISHLKLARLVLDGDIVWPAELSYDVFSRFLPRSLAYLQLRLRILQNSAFVPENLAPHIPLTLLQFESSNKQLESLVQSRIRQFRMSVWASE